MLGQGCVYPASTETLAGQLPAKHLTWRAYVEGMGEGESGFRNLRAPQLGVADPTISIRPAAASATAAGAATVCRCAYQASRGSAYATFRNPFVYFHSVIGELAVRGGRRGASSS